MIAYALVFSVYDAGCDGSREKIVAVSLNGARITSERDRLTIRTTEYSDNYPPTNWAETEAIYGKVLHEYDTWDCDNRACVCHEISLLGTEGTLKIVEVPCL